MAQTDNTTEIFRKAKYKGEQENNHRTAVPLLYLLALSVESALSQPRFALVGFFFLFISGIVLGFTVSFLQTLSESIFVVRACERTWLAE